MAQGSNSPLVEDLTVYNDGGANLPNVYVVVGKRIDLAAGMTSLEQVRVLPPVELGGYPSDEPVIVPLHTSFGRLNSHAERRSHFGEENR